jgi:hypothetical protein
MLSDACPNLTERKTQITWFAKLSSICQLTHEHKTAFSFVGLSLSVLDRPAWDTQGWERPRCGPLSINPLEYFPVEIIRCLAFGRKIAQ